MMSRLVQGEASDRLSDQCPELPVLGECRHVPPEDLQQRRSVQGMAERLPHGYEPLEFFGPAARLIGFGSLGNRVNFDSVSFPVLVEDEDSCEDDQARQQVELVAAFDVLDEVRGVVQWLLKIRIVAAPRATASFVS
jgi:hypothetical protein